MQSLMLGIDGGGTRCRGRLTDDRGQLLAEARGGPANVWSHFEAAIDAIDRVIDDLFTQAALPAAARAQTVLVAGLAGANVSSVKARLDSWQPVCQSRYVFTDVETACAGAHNGAPGAVFITGTGSRARHGMARSLHCSAAGDLPSPMPAQALCWGSVRSGWRCWPMKTSCRLRR